MYSCLSYPACKSHVVFGVSSSTISSALFHKGTIFEKKKNKKQKMCFDFLYDFCLSRTDRRQDGWTDRQTRLS
jgi:hypothetical protein